MKTPHPEAARYKVKVETMPTQQQPGQQQPDRQQSDPQTGQARQDLQQSDEASRAPGAGDGVRRPLSDWASI